MKVRDLVNEVRNISGYKSSPSSSVNSHIDLINDNSILKGINEAQKFTALTTMPNELHIPLYINAKTDIIGNDLIDLQLSSYNQGARVSDTSTVKWKEMLNVPWRKMVTGIRSLKRADGYAGYSYGNLYNSFIEYDTIRYMSLCSTATVGSLVVNRLKSDTLQYDFLSTLKTMFTMYKDNEVIGVHTVTVNTNVYKFSSNFINVNINFSTGRITASYIGKDSGEYRIEIRTLRQPAGIILFNDGILRTSKRNNVTNRGNLSVVIDPYSMYEPTQDVPSVYTHDIHTLLSYTAAMEVQRFNRSIDNNLSEIVGNKINDYQNNERFETRGRTNDLDYLCM